MTVDPLRKLLNLQSKNLLKLVYNLTPKHLSPNNLERQKVKLAVDLFRPEVIPALETCAEMKLPGFENIAELVNFLKDGGRWWNYHDV